MVPILPHMVSDTLNPPETFPESYFFNESDPLKVKITQHTRYSTPVMHKHDFYEMFYVYEGEFEQFIDNKTFVMRTGDICLVPTGVFHSLDVNNYSIVLNILIQKDSFQEIFFNNLSGDHIFSNFPDQRRLCEKNRQFHNFPNKRGPENQKYDLGYVLGDDQQTKVLCASRPLQSCVAVQPSAPPL